MTSDYQSLWFDVTFVTENIRWFLLNFDSPMASMNILVNYIPSYCYNVHARHGTIKIKEEPPYIFIAARIPLCVTKVTSNHKDW